MGFVGICYTVKPHLVPSRVHSLNVGSVYVTVADDPSISVLD